MKRFLLNKTELEVSALCLGTAQFGTGRSREESREQLAVYLENGGNFLDTAHVYGDWGSERKGLSESVIGSFLAENRLRSQVVLVTKGCHPPLDDMTCSRVNEKCFLEDLEGSLRNLKTDYIDLYLYHRDNPLVPVAELLECLEEQVRRGSIRYYGCSNWGLERVREAEKYAAEHGLKGFVCNQMMFTLADVRPESLTGPQLTIPSDEFFRYHKEKKMNFMAYMCMAGGLFTKLSTGRELPASAGNMYGGMGNGAIAGKLKEFAASGYSVTEFMLGYVLLPDFPTVPVVSFSRTSQLLDAAKAIDRQPPVELLREVIACKRQQVYRW